MLMLLLSASTLATAPVPPPVCTAGYATSYMNACMQQQANAADAELARYETAARGQLRKLGSPPTYDDMVSAPRMLAAFDSGEMLWRQARDAACAAVSETYGRGTGAASAELECQTRRTRLQTHAVWLDFLVIGGGTPPVLPEPPVGPGG